MLRLILLISLWYWCTWAGFGQRAANPYNLPLVNTVDAYQIEIEQNNDNEMVNLKTLIPGLVLDIRYATPNNFTGTQIYEYPAAWLRKPVALALARAQKAFDSLGLGLLVYYAYRPYAATLKFYEVYQDTRFVAHPAKGSRHNRGATLDMGLVRKADGKLLPMPTHFDHFGVEAFATYPHLDPEVKANREADQYHATLRICRAQYRVVAFRLCGLATFQPARPKF